MDICGATNVVHTYFSGGPVSIDIIEKNLYLGSLSAAKDLKTLKSYKITHILTLDICPLPRHIAELNNVTTKFVQLSDQPKEDILSQFDDCINFIEDGLAKGVVLVHCYFGISRSASVIIAYVMKKYGMSYHEAFDKVKLKRRWINPNQGFISQLKLYEEMGYTIDTNNMKYKVHRLSVAADKVRRAKILPNDYFDLIKADPGKTHCQPQPNVYQCKRCRRILANESNLIVH